MKKGKPKEIEKLIKFWIVPLSHSVVALSIRISPGLQ